MFELKILFDELSDTAVDVGELVITVHGICMPAWWLTIAVYTFRYPVDRSDIVCKGEIQKKTDQEKTCCNRHNSRDDTSVEACIKIDWVCLEIFVNEFIQIAEILNQWIIFRLECSEEPWTGIHSVCKKDCIECSVWTKTKTYTFR